MYIKASLLTLASSLLVLRIVAATPTGSSLQHIDGRDDEACCGGPGGQASYRIICSGGMYDSCLPGGSSDCRCDSYGTFLCGDQNCRNKCGCQRDPSIRVTGMDCIWHNLDGDSGFVTFRKWFNDDLDAMMARVAGHVASGLYKLVSVSGSKHSFVVVCICDKRIEEFPEGAMEG